MTRSRVSRFLLGVAHAALALSAFAASRTQPPPAPSALPVGSSADPSTATRSVLIEGVSTIASPGTPGTLTVWGPGALVIAVGKDDRDLPAPVIAAGTLGRGRIVAFPHTAFLDKDTMSIADTGRLIENAVRWASRKPHAEKPVVGLFGGDLATFLSARGFSISKLAAADLTDSGLASIDVLCIVGNNLSDVQVACIARFVERGGGLLAAQTAWAWKAPSGKVLTDNPLNRLAAPAGIAWTGGHSGPLAGKGFLTDGASDAMLHAANALSEIIATGKTSGKASDRIRLASRTALDAVRSLPTNDLILRPRIDQLMNEHAARLCPTEQDPLSSKEPLARLLLAASVERTHTLSPQEIRAHAASNAFPGRVPADAPRQTRSVRIDPRVADWHSTGLYAAPGEVIQVSIPAGAIDHGLRVRIGCHKDALWRLDTWKRVPEVTRETALTAATTQVASAFGGLVYIDIDKRFEADPFDVTIANAVEAPLFVLGRTTAEEWRSSIRARPAPWAELACKRIIISVPSTAIRELDDPTPLMEFWDRIAAAQDELATVSNLERHHRPDRIVADVQISAGYMHSGYPIMTHLDAVDEMTRIEKLRAGSWGLFHELGHNHQQGDWTFGGTVEVTCNLFTLYTMEKACGREPGQGHGALKDREEKVGRYLAAGAKFEKWKSDPFLALHMYQQLIEGFGWKTFQQVFAEYRGLNKQGRPANDDQKRDQWMIRFSRACGHNLGPFFESWGIPTSAEAREQIKTLPAWMPPGFPPS
ncbi:MAG: hypothetical protein IT438_13350 [Phycisphaerales bacterium]|nr:hypothetical protein [Phycisphaerales bacterium]